MRIVDELQTWEAHRPEALQAMLDNCWPSTILAFCDQ
jgi:hypothetical protein